MSYIIDRATAHLTEDVTRDDRQKRSHCYLHILQVSKITGDLNPRKEISSSQSYGGEGLDV